MHKNNKIRISSLRSRGTFPGSASGMDPGNWTPLTRFGAPIRGNTNKDEFDIRGGANKKLTYTGKHQFRGFETSVA